MGLDAFVRCRCWEEGRTSPPPMPVVLDEDDGVLAPDVAGEVATDDWLKVDGWVATACAHEDMHATWERISNWAGYPQPAARPGQDRLGALPRPARGAARQQRRPHRPGAGQGRSG